MKQEAIKIHDNDTLKAVGSQQHGKSVSKEEGSKVLKPSCW